MFVVLLRFSNNKAQAAQFMDGHNSWIKQGLNEGIFLLVGSLQPNMGGGILAHNIGLQELQDRVAADPFVEQDVVSAEILEITPGMADEKLEFLLAS